MAILIRAVAVIFLLYFLPIAALAEKRVALVIGNSAYKNAPALANPARDAEAIGGALKGLGFEVTLAINQTKTELDEALKGFGDAVRGSDWALFFFAGHGIAVGGETYIIPVDAKLAYADHVEDEAVSLTRIRAKASKASTLRLMVLDSCRNNPFVAAMKDAGRDRAVGRGLARPAEPEGDELIAYATRENTTADDGDEIHSPFTASLLANIETPGLEVGYLFRKIRDDVLAATGRRQSPAIYGELSSRPLYFKLPLEHRRSDSDRERGGIGRKPLSVSEESALQPGSEFKECDECPAMVVIKAGEFQMGSHQKEIDDRNEPAEKTEGPLHRVRIAKPFAAGKFEVTFSEWDACVSKGGCRGYRPGDEGWGREDRPVINVSWHDAKAYVAWLSGRTGKTYRLLSEAEWEYAARAGSQARYFFGDYPLGLCHHANIADESLGKAGYSLVTKCDDGFPYTAPVGSFAPNGFGLYDMLGNAAEWVEDPWHENYSGAPTDGSVWQSATTGEIRVARGGSYFNNFTSVRSATRNGNPAEGHLNTVGFRVARTLNR